MKALKLMAVFATFVLFAACGKSNEELLVGTWNEHETGNAVVSYKTDHSYLVEYEDGSTEDGKWRVDGDMLFMTESGSDEELESKITTLDDETFTEEIGGMFQTTYKRAK